MMGAIYSGALDYLAFPLYYPVQDDDELLEMASPFHEDTMTMTSMYNITTTRKTVDISHMYQSIPITLWLGLILSFAVYTLILQIGMRIMVAEPKTPKGRKEIIGQQGRKSNPRSTWIMARAFLSHPSFPAGGNFITSISLSSCIAIFFIMCYINGNVSTDLVVIDRPHTLNSYQDAIDADAITLLCSMLPEFYKFTRAPAGSIERKLVKRVQTYKMSLDISGVQRVLFHQEAVLVGRQTINDIFALATLDLTQSTPLRALRVIDPQAKKFTNVFVFNKNSHPVGRAVTRKSVKRMQEAGICQHIYNSVPSHMLTMSVGTVTTTLLDKLADKVEEQHIEMTPIGISNIYNMIKLYFSLIIFSIFSIIFEIFQYRRKEAERLERMQWRLVK